MDVKYYESHITIEPVFDDKLEKFKEICTKQNFRVAKLLMQKDRNETATRSNKDSFCTGHSKDYNDILLRMNKICAELKECKYEVWRYKIEAVILDEKLK